MKILVEAQTDAVAEIDFTVRKAAFFNRYREMLNERQLKVVRRMMEEGASGFKGGMSASKYMGITKASKATATRDLQDLAEKGVFVPEGGGRSRRYGLNLGQDTSFF